MIFERSAEMRQRDKAAIVGNRGNRLGAIEKALPCGRQSFRPQPFGECGVVCSKEALNRS